ncbi:MAG: hypothetical protein GY931_02890 [Maribacter sp.]|nr:hypothetical protein [Maribacter sp.]
MDQDQKSAYRNLLQEAEQKIGEGYDKTLIALSGGALAISVTFIKEIVGSSKIIEKAFLGLAWGSWALSLTSLLFAFYFGSLAYRYAIKALDQDRLDNTNPGGLFSTLTRWLNAIGGISFLVGVAAFLYFSYKNTGV